MTSSDYWDVKKFKLVVNDYHHMIGSKYQCTVVSEVFFEKRRWFRPAIKTRCLVVDIEPTMPLPDNLEECPNDYREDMLRVYPDGITRMCLHPRHEGFDIPTKPSKESVCVYMLMPKGRDDWEWGEWHIMGWAAILPTYDYLKS